MPFPPPFTSTICLFVIVKCFAFTSIPLHVHFLLAHLAALIQFPFRSAVSTAALLLKTTNTIQTVQTLNNISHLINKNLSVMRSSLRMVCGNLEKNPGYMARMHVADVVCYRQCVQIVYSIAWMDEWTEHTQNTRDSQLQKHNRQNKTSKYNRNVDSWRSLKMKIALAMSHWGSRCCNVFKCCCFWLVYFSFH